MLEYLFNLPGIHLGEITDPANKRNNRKRHNCNADRRLRQFFIVQLETQSRTPAEGGLPCPISILAPQMQPYKKDG